MPQKSNSSTRPSYRKALAILGVAASMAYSAPLLTTLGDANASGGSGGRGSFMGFGGFGSGGFGSGGSGGGGGPRGFGSGTGGFIINDQITATECSDCHQAYGGDALPAGAWRRMMGNLENHFGEDASLDERTRAHIENYLLSNAMPGDGSMRITEQNWFIGEHRGKGRRNVRLADCKACHGGRSRNGGWLGR